MLAFEKKGMIGFGVPRSCCTGLQRTVRFTLLLDHPDVGLAGLPKYAQASPGLRQERHRRPAICQAPGEEVFQCAVCHAL